MLECVVNFSEGRDAGVIESVANAGAGQVLDLHSDPDHHRSVITIAGPETQQATRAVARRAVELVDIHPHTGVHPRFGALDVVPFVALRPGGAPDASEQGATRALAARQSFASWASEELGLPCFLYGPERSLPETRRRAFIDLLPDYGPHQPHPTAGSCAVGARRTLVAYNVWLSTSDAQIADEIARTIRSPQVRALGMRVRDVVQISCNLVDPLVVGPEQVYDVVAKLARRLDTSVTRAELVGLAPAAVVEAVEPGRRQALDLDMERTIERRFQASRSRATTAD